MNGAQSPKAPRAMSGMNWPPPTSVCNQLPPAGERVLALELGATDWRLAQFLPSAGGRDANDGVAGWHFVGDDPGGQRAPVTHWIPMPPPPAVLHLERGFSLT